MLQSDAHHHSQSPIASTGMSSFHIANSSLFHYTNGTDGTSSTFFTKSTNGTICHDSPQNEVSPGSAAFITIALIFGCMTQLPGSLVTSNCNRFWRILPFMSLLEGLVIFFRMASPLFNSACTQLRRKLPDGSRWHLECFERQGRSTARVTAYALLAERLGNSRDYDYWLKLESQVSAPTMEQMLGLVDEIAALEDGLTLRPVVIVPMALQFFKLCIIKGGFLTVKVLPLIYFWSWFWVEVLLLLAHGEKLGDTDILEVDRILHLSVAPVVATFDSDEGRPVSPPPSASVGGRTSESRVEAGNELARSATEQQRPKKASERDGTELWARREQTWVWRNVLLANIVVEEDVPEVPAFGLPKYRVRFSHLQGRSSNWSSQQFWGTVLVLYDAIFCALPVYISLRLYGGNPAILIGLIFLTGFILIAFDILLGVSLAKLAEKINKGNQGFIAWSRDAVAFRFMMIILGYFTIVYTPEGTSKPDWLDWLG